MPKIRTVDIELFPNRNGINSAGAKVVVNGRNYCALLLLPKLISDIVLVACLARNAGVSLPVLALKVPEKDGLCMPIMSAKLVSVGDGYKTLYSSFLRGKHFQILRVELPDEPAEHSK